MAKAKTGGRKVVPQRIEHCAKGHVMFTYQLVPIKGRSRFLRSCECEIKPIGKS